VAPGPAGATATAASQTPDAPDAQRFLAGIAMAWAPSWGRALPRRSWRALDTASLDHIARAGATATSLRFDWAAIEPVRGARDWSYADQQVSEVEKRGLEPFAYAGSSPGWLGRDADARCPEPSRNPPPATRAGMAAFRDFFRALARRYCGRVKYYEFWSEPNGCGWMSCGCGDQTRDQKDLYAFWLDQWYQAMREGCSDVVLAIGGLDCGWGSDPDHPSRACGAFVDHLYDNGASDSFDAVALHPFGYAGDPEVALRDHKALNWEAIRAVTAALQRHGAAGRPLWIGWGFGGADDDRKAQLVGAALAGLRALPNVFAAQYLAISDPPGAASPTGLVALAGAPATARLEPRPAWFAFRDRVLGPGTVWHGPANPGMEFQGQPPSEQFTRPIPLWGPDGAWQFHTRFPRDGNAMLGRKFGYYSAGTEERFAQTLSDVFAPRRRYCFRSVAQGGRDNVGTLPSQIGYIDPAGAFVVLASRTAEVDARWRETPGVCHDTAAAGRELGRPIAIRFGAGQDGGAGDIWFDNLRVTSSPL
jgi:hypothetical protein